MKEKRLPSESHNERELFLAAIGLQGGERHDFLNRNCGNNGEFRRRIETLIKEHESQGDFLSAPAIAPRPPLDVDPDQSGIRTQDMQEVSEKPGARIGRYKLLQNIGEGGCGAVYMAEQERPVRRRVALKIIKLGMDTRGVVARFEAERQALAMMDHPNIAHVFDAGATETGRPYFAMELVRGIQIIEYANENHLTTRERLRLFIQVCQAIQHAHQKGIIHRDIKPSNILVTLHHDVPLPKVIDFGIAKAIDQKLTDKTLYTLFHSFIGTPAYMSPEQTHMTSLDIDTRSDIYSLGVLLYELLAGETPFDPKQLMSRGIDACRKAIQEVEPVRPSQVLSTMGAGELTTTAQRRRTDANRLIHQLRGDLDWIVMKCLDKDRTRRYDTAAALAEDVQRYLENEPISARPPSTFYLVRKFVRKHWVPVAAVVAVALALTLGTGISIWLAIRATDAEQRERQTAKNEIQLREQAERDKTAARLNEYVANINLAQQSLKDGNLGRAVQLLQRHIPERGERDLRGFEWRYLVEASKDDVHQNLLQQDEPTQALAFSPDSQFVVVSDREKMHVISLQNQGIARTISPSPALPGSRFRSSGRFPPPFIYSISFVNKGRILAGATWGTVRLWSTDNWEEIRTLENASGPITATADGKLLASELGSRGRSREEGVILWDTTTWQPTRTVPNARGPLAFSCDGKWLATDSAEGIRIWPVNSTRESTLLQNSERLFGRVAGVLSDRPLAFSPDGVFLVAARNTASEKGAFVLSIWDVETGEEVDTMPSSPEHLGHTGVISSLGFLPDGRILATASMDHSIRLWDFHKRELVDTLYSHLNEIRSMTVSPDGRTLVSGDKNGLIKAWETIRSEAPPPFKGIALPLGFSRDSGTLAVLDNDNAIVFINLATGESVRRFPLKETLGRSAGFALSDHLNILVQDNRDGTVAVWNVDTEKSTVLQVSNRPIELLAVSPDGRYLITGGRDEMPHWWDLRAGTDSPWDTEIHLVRFFPDGRSIVTFQRNGPTRIWDVETRVAIETLESIETAHLGRGFACTISSDGKHIAITLVGNSVGLWNAKTGDFVGNFVGHKQPVYALAFSPDNQTLATASPDSTLRLWNVTTRTELLMERQLGKQLAALVFSPDGHLLVGGERFRSSDTGLRLYHAPQTPRIKEHYMDIGAPQGNE